VHVRLRRLTAFPLVLTMGLAACTGGGSSETSIAPSTPSQSPLPTVDVGQVVFVPGKFAYSYLDVDVTLDWSGGNGTLKVHNGSGSELEEPGLYAVTAERPRVSGTVAGGAPIPAGASATFAVTFPTDLSPDAVGMIALLFGDENWGAFSPVPKDASPAP
jgi:hypothetical protein